MTATDEHPVLAELNRRRSAPTTTQTRLALAVEGGGMRGVVSAGMLAALEDVGVAPPLFDEVFGSSAGAMNAALYLGGQAHAGVKLYVADASDKQFKDPRRLFSKRPILDLDYLIDHVLEHIPALNPELVLKSRSLRAVATSLDTGKSVAFPPPSDWDELASFLKASACIPLVAGPPREVHGERFVDAGVGEAIPWETPIWEGYTHVLVLSTRSLGVVSRYTLERRLIDWLWIYRYGAKVRHLSRYRRATSQLRAADLAARTLHPGTTPPYVFSIAPNANTKPISQLETDPAAVQSAGLLGFNSVRQSFGLNVVTDYIDRDGGAKRA